MLLTIIPMYNSSQLAYTDFPAPIFNFSFTFNAGIIILQITIQARTVQICSCAQLVKVLLIMQHISEAVVPYRGYQYTTNNSTSLMMNFTGDYFEIDLFGVEAGQTVTVTVIFQREFCRKVVTANLNGKKLQRYPVCTHRNGQSLTTVKAADLTAN